MIRNNKKLINSFEEIMVNHQCNPNYKIYNLVVKENNIPAIKCYENFKFIFIKKEKDLYPYCNTNIPWNIMKLKI